MFFVLLVAFKLDVRCILEILICGGSLLHTAVKCTDSRAIYGSSISLWVPPGTRFVHLWQGCLIRERLSPEHSGVWLSLEKLLPVEGNAGISRPEQVESVSALKGPYLSKGTQAFLVWETA